MRSSIAAMTGNAFRWTDSSAARLLLAAAGLVAAVFCLSATAGSLYKYRDADGKVVYSDRPPDNGQAFEQQAVTASVSEPPVVTFRREQDGNMAVLWADNPCYCPAEVIARVLPDDSLVGAISVDPEDSIRQVVGPQSTTPVLTVRFRRPASVDFETAWMFGDPQAEPDGQPYRAPFAAGRGFLVSQAYPEAVTHVTADSRYAIDFSMPVQTAVYAARAGTVVEVTYRNFRGGADWGKYGAEANVVRILHDDGTFALYAHLSRESIRIRTGERVSAGQHIAASGNTGFSTGPHLHFVVLRNAGLRIESVPVTFIASGGKAVRAMSGQELVNP